MPYVVYDHEIKGMLVGLRGDKRRAMELAITKANTEHDAFVRDYDEKFKTHYPALNEAFRAYEAARLKLVEAFNAALPEDIRPAAESLGIDPQNVHNNPRYYSKLCIATRIERGKRVEDLQKLRTFLLTKQLAGSKPKLQTDAPALKLIEGFVHSKALCATNPTADTTNSTPKETR